MFSEGEIEALTASLRQLGVGSQGGAEALVTVHPLMYDEWASGSLVTPLASCARRDKFSAHKERSSGLVETPTLSLCGARRISTDV